MALNTIISYFVVSGTKDSPPRVFGSPVTINSETARELLQEQLNKTNEKLPPSRLFHVCYDVSSGILYTPNISEFTEEKANELLQIAKLRIGKDYGSYSFIKPINGNPFNILRIRKISNFSYAKNNIVKNSENGEFTDLTVIEANLFRMKGTLKQLPKEFSSESYWGGYVSKAISPTVKFIVSDDNNKNVYEQATPFILINMSATAEVGSSEKEWVILSGYRDYLHDSVNKKDTENQASSKENIRNFADLYAIKRHLYLGWTVEEVSKGLVLGTATNLGTLYNGISRLMMAVKSLKDEGYKDLASIPYYITFQIDHRDFPLSIMQLRDPQTGKMIPQKQLEFLQIIDFDPNTDYIIIKSSVYISPEVCKNVLKAKSDPFITVYNPVINKIDVKSRPESYSSMIKNENQFSKIDVLNKYKLPAEKVNAVKYRTGPEAMGDWAINTNLFNIKKISDYSYAYDFIKKMCDRNNVPFRDLDVFVGPVEKYFGNGVQGGFMDDKDFIKNKKPIPFEMGKGLWISPPAIFINSVKNPSYAKQTKTLIHEYRHYIFGQTNADYVKEYGNFDGKQGQEYYKEWYRYLSDPNEVAAHTDEIKYELEMGVSVDEIIRDKVGGAITSDNYPIALKFRQLVESVAEEVKEEGAKNEKPSGKSGVA